MPAAQTAELKAVWGKHPHRFSTTTDPRILALAVPAWINQPKEITEKRRPNGCLTQRGTA
ncbi:hypothetical protein GCM10009628_17610 [Paeniglutamicibacter kerguelensis]